MDGYKVWLYVTSVTIKRDTSANTYTKYFVTEVTTIFIIKAVCCRLHRSGIKFLEVPNNHPIV